MDLHELHERTGIELRKLRYCLDHDLIPGLYIELTPREAGRPRRFADDVGFGIVCAAKLLELGLPHQGVRKFLEGMLKLVIRGPGDSKRALVAVLEQGEPALAQLADGKRVRIVAGDPMYDSGWVPPIRSSKRAEEYKPVVMVTLDIGQIRDLVFGNR
jgi:hypothetical protein